MQPRRCWKLFELNGVDRLIEYDLHAAMPRRPLEGNYLSTLGLAKVVSSVFGAQSELWRAIAVAEAGMKHSPVSHAPGCRGASSGFREWLTAVPIASRACRSALS